ncbi:MAG: cobyrinic acid a,c-diamide synthase, partial [Pseudomonadota bacterium]
MALGETLIDRNGAAHAMAGLLPVTTSFATPKLTLGYRALRAEGGPWPGANNLVWRGHEFHFSTAVEERGTPLFTARDADGAALPAMGLRSGNVSGSYAHLIAPHRPETP